MSACNEWGQPIGPALPNFSAPRPPARAPLVGRFCRVEPLDPARHAAELWQANTGGSGSHWTYLPYGPFDAFASYAEWLRERALTSDPLFFSIVLLEAEQPVGVASYLRIEPSSASIEVGHLSLSPRLARSPAATEAMYLMMKHAFELGYRRYEWKCDALNAPSRAAAERLGFLFEGIFRQAAVYKGRSRDTAWYSIIDSEWPALERALSGWLEPDNFDTEGVQRRRLSELTRQLRPMAR